jgi:hypothetical protein
VGVGFFFGNILARYKIVSAKKVNSQSELSDGQDQAVARAATPPKMANWEVNWQKDPWGLTNSIRLSESWGGHEEVLHNCPDNL